MYRVFRPLGARKNTLRGGIRSCAMLCPPTEMGVVAFGCIWVDWFLFNENTRRVFAHCRWVYFETEADAVTLGALVNCCDKAGVIFQLTGWKYLGIRWKATTWQAWHLKLNWSWWLQLGTNDHESRSGWVDKDQSFWTLMLAPNNIRWIPSFASDKKDSFRHDSPMSPSPMIPRSIPCCVCVGKCLLVGSVW